MNKKKENLSEKEREYEKINARREALFQLHVENEYPVLKSRDVCFNLRLIEQLTNNLVKDKSNAPKWVDIFLHIDEEDKGKIFTIHQILRTYVTRRTRTLRYRINLLRCFMYKPKTGRSNLDGTKCEITPNDAINAVQLLKKDENYSQFEGTHLGNLIKMVERNLNDEGSVPQ